MHRGWPCGQGREAEVTRKLKLGGSRNPEYPEAMRQGDVGKIMWVRSERIRSSSSNTTTSCGETMAKHLQAHQPQLPTPAQSSGTQVPALCPWFSPARSLLQGPYYKVPFCGLSGGGGTLSILPGGPYQPEAYDTCLPSFLQCPLKNRCASIPPWSRENENPKLHFALEHIALLSKVMQFRGGPPPRERAGWRRVESRHGEANGQQFEIS